MLYCLFFFIFVVISNQVYAAEEFWKIPPEYKNVFNDDIYNHLKSPRDYGGPGFITTEVMDVFRNIGLGLIQIIYVLAKSLENMFRVMVTKLSLFGFIFSQDSSWINGLFPLTMFVGIIFGGLKIMNPLGDSDEKSKLMKLFVKGFLSSVFLFGVLGLAYTSMEGGFSKIGNTVYKSKNNLSMVDTMLSSNIIDVEDSFKKKKIIHPLSYDISNWSRADTLATIENKDDEILGYSYKKKTGGIERNKLKEQGVFGLNKLDSNEYHLKYKIDFGFIYINMIAFILMFLLNIFKYVRNLIEMFFSAIGLISTNVDFTNYEKRKLAVEDIAGLFFNNIYIVFSVALAMLLMVAFDNQIPELQKHLNVYEGKILSLIIYVTLFYVMLDGPSIIQKLTGIDAGLRSGTQAMLGAYGASKAIGGIAKGGAKLFGKATGASRYMDTRKRYLDNESYKKKSLRESDKGKEQARQKEDKQKQEQQRKDQQASKRRAEARSKRSPANRQNIKDSSKSSTSSKPQSNTNSKSNNNTATSAKPKNNARVVKGSAGTNIKQRSIRTKKDIVSSSKENK